jgi:hypothetical protein
MFSVPPSTPLTLTLPLQIDWILLPTHVQLLVVLELVRYSSESHVQYVRHLPAVHHPKALCLDLWTLSLV